MNDKARYTSDQCFGWPIQALFWLEWATQARTQPDVIRSVAKWRVPLHPIEGYANVVSVYPARPTAARTMNGLPACCCR
jgi:hypothetical protein